MASFHSRSNSLPSKSHPVMDDVENLLCRLNSSQSASTSSIDSLCSNLETLRNLHGEINNMIQMPSVQLALSNEQGESWVNELLEASIGMVDLCGFSREVIYATKESVQEFESSIRRNRAESSATSEEFNGYIASRKKIIKKVNKHIKNLKGFNQRKDNDLKSVIKMLKEAQVLDFLVLRSVLMFVSGEKERSKQKSWSLLAKFVHSSRVHSQEEQENGVNGQCSLDIQKYSRKSTDNITMLKQLKACETIIQEIEEELDALFKSLIKTRVSLLNILSH